ncbi:MAG TPA: laccase domain-containing protein, partial [Gammaproteobacteria bacterium]|nr:laccase domain-containing protein [Gammaproteobacteria bacterium]
PAKIIAWLGPHVCARHYEVRVEVRERCLAVFGQKAHTAFTATQPDHWQADLEQLARLALGVRGVTRLYRTGLCTYERADLLYSHRRDGNAGRFASLIWMTPE